MARAMVSRWTMPREKVRTGSRRRAVSPTCSSTASMRASGVGQVVHAGKKAQVLVGRQVAVEQRVVRDQAQVPADGRRRLAPGPGPGRGRCPPWAASARRRCGSASSCPRRWDQTGSGTRPRPRSGPHRAGPPGGRRTWSACALSIAGVSLAVRLTTISALRTTRPAAARRPLRSTWPASKASSRSASSASRRRALGFDVRGAGSRRAARRQRIDHRADHGQSRQGHAQPAQQALVPPADAPAAALGALPAGPRASPRSRPRRLSRRRSSSSGVLAARFWAEKNSYCWPWNSSGPLALQLLAAQRQARLGHQHVQDVHRVGKRRSRGTVSPVTIRW